jgi:hypothetical protein
MFGFKLNNVLRSSSAANGDDVLNMKQGLNKLGHYEAPAYGMTPYPDTPMFDGMKAFQKRNGLTVDGYARPGGPTEKTLNSHLANTAHDLVQRKDLNQYEYPDKSKRPGKVSTLFAYDPELTDPFYTPKPKVKTAIQKVDWNGRPLRLGGGVGQGQVNRGQDVVGLKNALAWTGHYPIEKAHLGDSTPDEDLNWGLRGFQRDFGLKTDGFSRPGGETEARLNDLISPLIQKISASADEPRSAEWASDAPVAKMGAATSPDPSNASHPVQVADASGYRPSGWQNPTKWALEAAGKQVKGAVEEVQPKDNTPKHHPETTDDNDTVDQIKPSQQDYKWEEGASIGGRRDNFSFETDGAVKVGLHSATLGADGLRFYARWSELDEGGNVVQELWSDESWENGDPRRQEHGGSAGFNTGQDITLEPPFESGSGSYRVDIVIPPNATYNGNSAGVDINVFSQRGGTLSELQ